ncbi:DUF2510 domain-containing protein [Gordonia amicalis]|uniref:DUF2510 domain-containing protein n=1 Tax=Gordonia amicalis TaxID=89053 RepID=UPI00374EDEC2
MTSGPGWFEDPNDPRRVRWWDGTQWTESTNPAPLASIATQPPLQQPIRGRYRWVLITVLAALSTVAVVAVLAGYLTHTQDSVEPGPDKPSLSVAGSPPSNAATRSRTPTASPSQQSRPDTSSQTTPQTPESPLEVALEPGTKMCQLGANAGAVYYLYLISKDALDFSACNNSPSVEADGYSIVGDPAFGPSVDVRCHIDPGGYMNNAVGTVYSSSEPANLREALEFCGNVGGYGP